VTIKSSKWVNFFFFLQFVGCIDSWFVSCVKSVNSTSMESLWKEVKCNALGVHCAGSFNFFNLHKGGTQCNCSVGSLFPGRSLCLLKHQWVFWYSFSLAPLTFSV